MIFGIGTDVVEVSRIHESIEKFGDTFARRILSDSEFESYLKSSTQSRFLAKRFAAKEAFAKAQPIIDKAAQKGIIHQNKAARIKSRLSLQIKGLAA